MAAPNFVATFDTALDLGVWDVGGTAGVLGGNLVLTDGSYIVTNLADPGWDFVKTEMTWELTPPVPDFEGVALQIVAYNDASNYCGFQVHQGVISRWLRLGGVSNFELETPYDPVAMRWLRVREYEGHVYWEYSAEGTVWVNLDTQPTPGFPALVRPYAGLTFQVISTEAYINTISFLPTPTDVDFDGFYSIGLHPATAGVSAKLLAHSEPGSSGDPVQPLSLRWSSFDLETGIIEDGVFTDTPEIGAVLRTVAGVGEYTYEDIVVVPQTFLTGATARWMPLPGSLVVSGGEDPVSTWVPMEGNAELTWITESQYAPVLDADYVYSRGRELIYRQAMIFDSNSWFTLNAEDWLTPAATMVVVAVLKAGTGGEYGVFESTGEEGETGRPWGLRYSHGQVDVWSGAPILGHEVTDAVARPVILALTVDVTSGKLVVVDRTRSSRTFSTDGFGLYDMEMLLGRTSEGVRPASSAVMDVLDVMFWDRSLTFDELEELLSNLDAAYGVSL